MIEDGLYIIECDGKEQARLEVVIDDDMTQIRVNGKYDFFFRSNGRFDGTGVVTGEPCFIYEQGTTHSYEQNTENGDWEVSREDERN